MIVFNSNPHPLEIVCGERSSVSFNRLNYSNKSRAKLTELDVEKKIGVGKYRSSKITQKKT